MGRLTVLVLGSAAGGGFPQWNCRCPTCRLAWAGDARVRPRTQASLAVSADGENEIIKRCTGEVTFGEIVDDLAKTYAAPREKILADVGALLRGLADKTLGIVIKTGQVIGSKVTWRYRVPQWCTSRSVCSPS
jgi:coenzyme PQQ biosynthesis protein B